MKWPGRSQNGLTLVELMVAMVLSLVLMAAVYMAYQVQHKTTTEQMRFASAQQDLRAIMNLIGTDLKLAGMRPYGRANTGILIDAALTGNESYAKHFIAFTYDENHEMTPATPLVRTVRYYLDGADPAADKKRDYTLMRQLDSGDASELAYHVSTFHLEYQRDNVWTESPPPSKSGSTIANDVDAIRLTLTLWADDGQTDRRMTRVIACRNMH